MVQIQEKHPENVCKNCSTSAIQGIASEGTLKLRLWFTLHSLNGEGLKTISNKPPIIGDSGSYCIISSQYINKLADNYHRS